MKLSELKTLLPTLNQLNFKLENGSEIPVHFHITEVGMVTKNFIDCGGTLRKENFINFQLWFADDYNHRLSAEKLLHIIDLSERTLAMEDAEIEVEYQSETIGKYGLAFERSSFILKNKTTDCLAKDKCGVPPVKQKINIAELVTAQNCCTPNSGCC